MKKIEKMMLKEAKRLKKTKEVEYCKPNCVECLIATAKSVIDEKLDIEMSTIDFVYSMCGEATMGTDFIMLDLIRKIKSRKLKI